MSTAEEQGTTVSIKSNSIWTAELRARFLELLNDPDKPSYAEIAAQLSLETGIPVSRNAAIGIGKRMNVPTRKGAMRQRKHVDRIERRMRRDAEKRKQMLSHSPVVEGGTLRIEELKATSCRWPFGDRPPFMFCGCVQTEGSPYCTTHTMMGRVRWQPTQSM